MTGNSLLTVLLAVVPSVIVFLELTLLLPFAKHTGRIFTTSRKAFSVIRSKNISDTWKERALTQYSWLILSSSLAVSVFLVIISIGFAATYLSVWMLLGGTIDGALDSFKMSHLHIFALGFGVLYAFLRLRLRPSGSNKQEDYGLPSRLLHHIALNSDIVKDVAFDLDCMAAKKISKKAVPTAPVYVCGLARSGTTVLLEALYATGRFASITYRDMPFPIAPYMWSRLTGRWRLKDTHRRQRAHGDKIMVDFNSPEAFEEVFWMAFSGKTYIKGSHLEAHDVQGELIEKYRTYVANILASRSPDGHMRYLAKNNNNLLRIDALRASFQNAVILVPFRNPSSHARSLLGQHKRFSEIHAENSFALKYMNWLGHFEFGANMKPFILGPGGLPESPAEALELKYWLRYWGLIYEYVLEAHSSEVLFFDYDKLCEQPEHSFAALESALSLPSGALQDYSVKIQPSVCPSEDEDIPLPRWVHEVYCRLKDSSL